MSEANVSAASLTAKVKTLEGNIDRLQRSLNQRATMTAVGGVVVVLLLCGYFYFAYTQIIDLVRPNNLVAFAGEMFESNLPDIRVELENQIKQNAPKWAEDASGQLVANMPKAREHLEQFLENQADERIATMSGFSEKEFEKFLKENHAFLEDGFVNLQGGSDKSEQFIASLIPLFEKELGIGIKEGAEQLLLTAQDINRKLELMKEGKNLDDVMTQSRQILMISRRIYPPETANVAKLESKVNGQKTLPARPTGNAQ